MYEMLLIWFFCIVFFTTSGIALALTHKPLKQAENADCAEDESMDYTDEFEGEVNLDETPEPVIIPRTGKVTMLAENLAKVLNIVKDAIPTRTVLPIVMKVLVEFKDGMATFTATNLETAIITRCGCKIESEFTCVLPFSTLKDMSTLLYDDIVVVEKNGDRVSFIQTSPVTNNKHVCNFNDDNPKDYPPMPKVEGQSVVISELSEAIKQVKDKIIPFDNKHWNCGKFAGLFFDLSKSNIVASDGNRMKIAKLNCEPKPLQFRIDKDCALTLAKMKDMNCLVTTNENATRFDFGQFVGYGMVKPYNLYATVITQNLKGEYPDYEALKESHKELVSVL
jgi:DNA polymerase III sliding clamp (beta) subunit (PCNA family)